MMTSEFDQFVAMLRNNKIPSVFSREFGLFVVELKGNTFVFNGDGDLVNVINLVQEKGDTTCL
jgi:hypothetical protein